MELPYHLKTLEPLTGALDILRYLVLQSDYSATVEELQEALGIGAVTFGKAIRRLVTKSYVQMDSAESYRLTDTGRRAAEELLDYETAPDKGGTSSSASVGVPARLVLVADQPLIAGQKADIQVGAMLEAPQDLPEGADLLVRLSAIHAEPGQTQDASFMLTDTPQSRTFSLTPQPYTAVRVRVEVYQMLLDGEEVVPCGGLYVDLPVSEHKTASSERAAYGVSLMFSKSA